MRKGLLRAGLAAGVVGFVVLVAPARVAWAEDCTRLPGARVGQCGSTTTTTVTTAAPEDEAASRQASDPAGPDASAKRLLMDLVNDERHRAGVPPVATHPDIDRVAGDHSAAMAAEGRIWHNDAYFSSSSRDALGARALGENVALNADADDAHARLMASPPHRANILDARFTHLGVGAVRDADGVLYITQDFAQISQVSQPSEGSEASPISAPAAAGPPPSSAAIAPPAPTSTTAPPEPPAAVPEPSPSRLVLAAGDALHAPEVHSRPAAAARAHSARPDRHEEGIAGAVMAIAAVGLCERAGRRAAPFLFKDPSPSKTLREREGIWPIGPKS